MKRIIALAALGGLIALPACTSGQSAVEPPKTIANVTSNELQFQVGTANYSGTTYLNTVVTFRQPNGLSALLVDTPAISLPFTNTAPASVTGATTVNYAGNDTGKPQITGEQILNNGSPVTDPRTFPMTVGAFAYGFLASNTQTTGAYNPTFYPVATSSQEAIRMPIYGAAVGVTQRAFYVGTPFATVPASIAPGFIGYPSGFTSFAITPTTGTYSLTVGLPNASTPIPNFTSTTQLTSLALLPAMPAPTFATDGAGGGTVSVVIPAGVLETAVFIRDLDVNTGGVDSYHTVVFHATGAQTATLPDTTFANAGDTVSMVAIGFDYPAMEAVPMAASPPQAPVINNSGAACSGPGTTSTCPGQADITVSPAGAGTE